MTDKKKIAALTAEVERLKAKLKSEDESIRALGGSFYRIRAEREAAESALDEARENLADARGQVAALREALNKWAIRQSYNPQYDRVRRYCPECKEDDMAAGGGLRPIPHYMGCKLGLLLAAERAKAKAADKTDGGGR